MNTFGQLVQRHAQVRGSAPAYVDHRRRTTWQDIHLNSDALGRYMRELGVSSGDRVGIVSPDCVEVAEVFYACAKIGALRVGLNGRLAARELAQLVDDSAPAVLFVHARYGAMVEAALLESTQKPVVIGMHDGHPFLLDYTECLTQAAGIDPLPQTPNDHLMICYTTGSTGLPKGAVYQHEAMLRSTQAIALAEGANHDDVWLHAMPASGVPIMHLLRNVVHGSKTVIVGDWDPAAALALIEQEKTTITVLVPTMLASLVTSGRASDFDLSSMRQWGYGASPLPPSMVREAARVLGGKLLQMYGTTELMGMSMMLFPSEHELAIRERPGLLSSAGRPLPYVDVRIVDDEMRDVPAGEVGELLIRTEFVTSGYWNAPEKYAEAVNDGWLCTGDIARQDEDGYLYLSDRAKFRIKTGGYNVFPTEIENVIAEHEAVREVCVVGLPDEKWGDRIHAVVSVRAGFSLTPDDVRAFCRDKIASFKIPKTVEIWDEIPKGPTGKIQKRSVIDSYLQAS